VKGIGWDILFQNADTEINPETGKSYEDEFATVLQETPSVIATAYQTRICANELDRLYNLYSKKEYQ